MQLVNKNELRIYHTLYAVTMQLARNKVPVTNILAKII